MCVWGGGDQNSSISLHVSEMFKLLGAFTPEMPSTISFVDSVLYEIQTKKLNMSFGQHNILFEQHNYVVITT